MIDSQDMQQSRGPGDGDNNNPGGNGFGFNQVQKSGNSVLQFIAQNTQTIQNVLNSDIASYNLNPVKGATVYHLLLQLLTDLNALWTTFDQQYGQFDPDYDHLNQPLSEEESVKIALEELAIRQEFIDAARDANEENIQEEYNQIGMNYQQATGVLTDLIAFFEPYAAFVAGNAFLAHQTNALINQGILPTNVPPIYPGQGTVQQIMSAQNYQENLALAKITGRRVLPPGGDPSGRDRSGRQ